MTIFVNITIWQHPPKFAKYTVSTHCMLITNISRFIQNVNKNTKFFCRIFLFIQFYRKKLSDFLELIEKYNAAFDGFRKKILTVKMGLPLAAALTILTVTIRCALKCVKTCRIRRRTEKTKRGYIKMICSIQFLWGY